MDSEVAENLKFNTLKTKGSSLDKISNITTLIHINS